MVICAWCNGRIATPGGERRRSTRSAVPVAGPSHGICPSCAATQLARLADGRGAPSALR